MGKPSLHPESIPRIAGTFSKEAPIANLIGALRVTLSADTAAFSSGMNKAQRQAAQSSSSISKSLRNIQTALVGMIGAAAGTYLAKALKDALNFAGGLGEIATAAGSTIEQYQILTRAAIAAGISQDQLDAALMRLNRTLGDAKRGSEQALRALHGLGISDEQIRSLERGGDLLPHVMEGLKNLGSSSEQASRAQEIFGRSGSKLLPILIQGADGYNAMAEEARRAGMITEEQAAAADEAADSIDLLAYSFKTQLAVAIADNIPAVEALIDKLTDLINFAGRALGVMSDLTSKGDRFQDFVMANMGLTPGIRRQGMMAQAQGALRGGAGTANQVLAAFIPGVGKPTSRPSTSQLTAGPSASDMARGGGRGKSAEQAAREAERERERIERERIEGLRDTYDFESEIRRGKIDELAAQQDLTEDYLARASYAKQILDLELEQEREALRLAVQTGELTEGQAQQIAAQNAIIAGLERQRIDLDTQESRRDEFERFERQRFDIARRQLEGQADLAETAAERRAIELRILDLAYDEERARLERLAVEGRTFAEQQQARIELAALNDRQSLDRAYVRQGTMGPMEAFMKSLPDTAAKANEALEYVAANGIADIIDGLATASFSIKDLGKTFSNIAKQIVADLIRIQIQKAVVGALSGTLGGLGSLFGGGPSNLLSGTPYATPGLASGGSGIIRGRSGIDTNLLSLNGKPVAWVSQGERLSVSPDGRRGGDTYYLSGNLMTPEFWAQINAGDIGAARAGAQGGVALMGQRQSRRL